MIVREELCSGCLDCLPYCPMSAIVRDEAVGVARINEDECVEFRVC